VRDRAAAARLPGVRRRARDNAAHRELLGQSASERTQSGASFVRTHRASADPQQELGLVAFKEQYVLNARRSIVHFGHARWREAEQEMADAALWLSESLGVSW
jgi:hypothetical protein